MRMRVALALAIALAIGTRTRSCCDRTRAPLVFATFNIEDWPRHDRQIEGAFDEIARLGAGFIAVQEITDPALFQAEAANRLGGAWQFVAGTNEPHPTHHTGVLFDRRLWTFVDAMSHDETRLGGAYKPTLEVRLRPADGGDAIRILVVHLKASGDPESIAVRARQLRALVQIVAYRRDEPTVLLGDFNATGPEDRDGLAALARETGLHWTTRDVACTAFWDRDDGCFRSRLDHALAWTDATDVSAAGACATHGCDAEPSCPVYTEDVSDHCPVVVELPAP